MPTINTFEDAARVSLRIWRQRGVDILPSLFAKDGREELTPEREDDLIVEYGYDALVRYYAPKDPRLPSLEAV